MVLTTLTSAMVMAHTLFTKKIPINPRMIRRRIIAPILAFVLELPIVLYYGLAYPQLIIFSVLYFCACGTLVISNWKKLKL